MVFTCRLCGVDTVLLWCLYSGFNSVYVATIIWCPRGLCMVFIWCLYGVTMVSMWCLFVVVYDVYMVSMWCSYSVCMVSI